ncbi:hypothetical protein BaRGS_00009429 [Batillaria attramentaria]|uniref:Uncharacterized protein n=1 Tax=Batillaria attramentaria TaxID=370345 RepID=A0ABD0LIV9_9CAEN
MVNLEAKTHETRSRGFCPNPCKFYLSQQAGKDQSLPGEVYYIQPLKKKDEGWRREQVGAKRRNAVSSCSGKDNELNDGCL